MAVATALMWDSSPLGLPEVLTVAHIAVRSGTRLRGSAGSYVSH